MDDSNGRSVDARGKVAYDPSENVIALTKAEARRQDDLREAQDKYQDMVNTHVRELVNLRALFVRDMSIAESKRVDAIRQVDQANVSATAERALAAIQTLERTTASNAENIRTTLTTTATTIAAQWAQTVAEISKRVAALEQTSYASSGKSAGMSASWGVLIGVATLVAALIGIGTFIFLRPASQQPQIIYAPASPGTLLPSPVAPTPQR